jgi:hypothetical protein
MRGEALREAAARPIDESVEPVLEMPTGDSDAVSGYRPSVPPVADSKGLLEELAHLRREGALLVIADEDPAATQ